MKRTLIAASVLVSVHALCLAILPSAFAKIFAGNVIRFACMGLLVWTLLQAYRRTAGLVRIFLLILAAAFVPAIVRIVYEAFFDLRMIPGSFYFILLLLHIAPPVAVLIVPERVAHYRDLRPYALDIVQLAIALGSFYFLFYYPLHRSGATPESMSLLIQARNYVLIGVLPLRILISRRATVRDVLLRILLFAGLMQFDLLLEQAAGRKLGIYTGSWLDLLGTVYLCIVPVLIVGIPASSEPFVKPESRPLSFTLRAHVMPAVLPAAVWLMAISAAHEHKNLAVLLSTAAAVCYGARWYVVQRQASRDALQLWISERRLRALAEAFSQREQEAFFQSIAIALSKSLGAKYALISELLVGSEDTVRTLAVAKDGKPAPQFTYTLHNTPCAKAIAEDFCHFERGVAAMFPQDTALVDMGAESYMGMRVHSPGGSVLGLLVLINDRPLPDPEAARSLLRICSTPVGIEIERARTEEGLRSSEQKLALAFKQSPNGVAIVDAADETHLEVNDSFAALYGATRSEIIGRTATELGIWTDPSDRNQVLKELREKGKLRNFEFAGRTRTGELKIVQANGDTIEYHGKCFWLLTLRDVTLERAAERALQQSERKYRDLFQNANDFIFTLDFDGKFLSMNRRGEVLTGLVGVESTKQSFDGILAPSNRRRFRENFAQVLAGEAAEIFEVALPEKNNGSPAPVLEVALRLVSQDGQPVAVQGIARDVSDRRALEKKFLQAQKLQAMGSLAGGIAHDFNNLLTVITGYVHLVLSQLSLDSPALKDIEEIGNATERAASLTRQLLTFSRQQVTHRVALNLNDSVRGMERMLRRLLGDQVQLNSSLQQGLPRVMADAGQIDQVILNLAVNARDAMPAGGSLEFRTKEISLNRDDTVLGLPAGPYVLLEVIDTGAGMDEATQARVFEPFFTTKEVGKGTGLGLSTVYGIVQDCGGYIGVKSAVGRGSTFQVYLPALTSSQDQRQPSVERLGLVAGSETILLVEDDKSIRGLAAKILETSGYRVLTAGDVRSARAVLDDAANTIDLMVTDVMIPGGSGVELAQHAESVRPAMKSFYISGNPGRKLPPDAILLKKPFSPVELAVRIRTLLDESR